MRAVDAIEIAKRKLNARQAGTRSSNSSSVGLQPSLYHAPNGPASDLVRCTEKRRLRKVQTEGGSGMPRTKRGVSHLGAERRARLATPRQGPDDFSDYLEYGYSSADELREFIESVERCLRGEERTYPLEEIVAELGMEDSARWASSHSAQQAGSPSAKSDRAASMGASSVDGRPSCRWKGVDWAPRRQLRLEVHGERRGALRLRRRLCPQ